MTPVDKVSAERAIAAVMAWVPIGNTVSIGDSVAFSEHNKLFVSDTEPMIKDSRWLASKDPYTDAWHVQWRRKLLGQEMSSEWLYDPRSGFVTPLKNAW